MKICVVGEGAISNKHLEGLANIKEAEVVALVGGVAADTEATAKKHKIPFYTGTDLARYLAYKYEGVAIRNSQGVPKAWISKRIGGHQIDYADESRQVRTMFADALAAKGMKPKMEAAYEAEKATLPPLTN